MIDGNKLGTVGLEKLGTPYSEMDCQAFVEWCLSRCGQKKDLAGSNAWYREVMKNGTVLTPEECVEKVMPSILRLARFDVLPCMVYPFSMEQMRMGEDKSAHVIRKVARMNRASHHIDDKGGYHPLVREMGIKLAPGGSFVIVESLFDQALPACEPELLTRDNACYQRSPAQSPLQAQKLGQTEQMSQEEQFSLRPH